MSVSTECPRRGLVADTETPGAEITLYDGSGKVIAKAVARLQTTLPLGLYKLRFRVGGSVTDTLVELPPGEGDLVVAIPRLPFETAAPITRRGKAPTGRIQLVQELCRSASADHGNGSQLLVFIDADHQPATPSSIEIRKFSGDLIEAIEIGGEHPGAVPGRNISLDPGAYLLRSGDVEQTIITAEGWHTQVYVSLSDEDDDRCLDMPQAAILMARIGSKFDPDDAGLRWTEVARQALAAGRGSATDSSLIQTLTDEMDKNPMLGILTAHLLLLAGPEAKTGLARIASRLEEIIPGHPDVASLSYELPALRRDIPMFPTPPMLRSSWGLIVRSSSPAHDPIGPTSYSARIAGQLWGTGAWLAWTTPAEIDQPVVSRNGSADLATLLQLLMRRTPERQALATADLAPVERTLLDYAENMLGQTSVANQLTAIQDKSKMFSAAYPLLRSWLLPSDIQKQVKSYVRDAGSPDKVSASTGVPFASLANSAASLLQKIDMANSSQGSALSNLGSSLSSLLKR